MDIDVMAIKVRELLAFRDRFQPLLEEMEQMKAEHSQRLHQPAPPPDHPPPSAQEEGEEVHPDDPNDYEEHEEPHESGTPRKVRRKAHHGK